MLLALLMLFCLNTLADTTLNFTTNGSRMKSTPVQNGTYDEQTFEKNSVSLFGQSSFAKETLFVSAQMEVINIARRSYAVNQITLPRLENQGVRSLELRTMQYFYTNRGWKIHIEEGLNTKGYEKNSDVKFSLLHNEYTLGLVLIKRPSNKGIFKPILLGMMGVSDRSYINFATRYHFGKDYKSVGTAAYLIQPIRKNMSLKLLVQTKNYNFDTPTPEQRFLNERKGLLGLIFHTRNYHAMEFGLFYDNNIKEVGASLGYSYYFSHNKHNPATQAFQNIKDRYLQKQANTQPATNKTTTKISKEEIRQMVKEILEEEGYN